jgi:hypothetical protein
MHQAALVSHGK